MGMETISRDVKFSRAHVHLMLRPESLYSVTYFLSTSRVYHYSRTHELTIRRDAKFARAPCITLSSDAHLSRALVFICICDSNYFQAPDIVLRTSSPLYCTGVIDHKQINYLNSKILKHFIFIFYSAFDRTSTLNFSSNFCILLEYKTISETSYK